MYVTLQSKLHFLSSFVYFFLVLNIEGEFCAMLWVEEDVLSSDSPAVDIYSLWPAGHTLNYDSAEESDTLFHSCRESPGEFLFTRQHFFYLLGPPRCQFIFR